jgi:uncharacterized membrane protein YhhN
MVMVVVLLAAEYHCIRSLVWAAKPVAAAAYVGVALSLGALETGYGRFVLAALVLSWFGDVLLIPRKTPRLFRAGLQSFLMAHIALTAAFLVRGVDWEAFVIAALAVAAASALVGRWLRAYLPKEMVTPVYAYIVTISLMLIFAVGAVSFAGKAGIFIGALMFYFSDLAVARERFVASSFLNRAWGLPLYFGGQLVLATTVA